MVSLLILLVISRSGPGPGVVSARVAVFGMPFNKGDPPVHSEISTSTPV